MSEGDLRDVIDLIARPQTRFDSKSTPPCCRGIIWHIVKKSANPAAVTVDDRGRKSKGYSQSRKTLLLNEIDGRGVCAHAAKEPA